MQQQQTLTVYTAWFIFTKTSLMWTSSVPVVSVRQTDTWPCSFQHMPRTRVTIHAQLLSKSNCRCAYIQHDKINYSESMIIVVAIHTYIISSAKFNRPFKQFNRPFNEVCHLSNGGHCNLGKMQCFSS